MANNSATATWQGGLKEGTGNLRTQSGILSTPYNFGARFADEPGTNPEELIAAAHAGCFSMFLASVLEKNGTPATEIKTEAKVTLGQKDGGPHITKIELTTKANVPGIDQAMLDEKAKFAKENCPISKVLAAVPEMTMKAELVS